MPGTRAAKTVRDRVDLRWNFPAAFATRLKARIYHLALVCLSLPVYGLACAWGTTFLLLVIFRETFLHFIETSAYAPVTNTDKSNAPISGAAWDFDY